MKRSTGPQNLLLPKKNQHLVFIIIYSFFISGSYAETNKPEESLNQYRQLLAEQEKKFEHQRQLLNEQGKELERLRKHLDTLSKQSSNISDKGKPQPQTSTVSNSQPKDETKKLTSQAEPSGPVGQAPPESKEPTRPPEMPRLDNTVGGVLTKKGNIVVEPSLTYAFSDNNRVFLDAFTFIPALAIGLIDVREIKRHNFIATLGARYGVTDRWEVEARVPYVYRYDIQRSRPVSIDAATDKIFNADGNSIGDIQLASRYQITDGSGGWPILVGNLVATIPTGKSPFDVDFVRGPTSDQNIPGALFPTSAPTGVGFFSFQPSVTALYPTDPAVFFGNLNYTYNATTKESVGKINPGDAVGMTFGMGFSVNERTSFNLGYSHRHFFNSAVNGNNLVGTGLDIGQFLLGYSFKYTPQTNINLSLGVGTTDNAQDVTLNLRVPITFGLMKNTP